MRRRDRVNNEYYKWLCDIVRFPTHPDISYENLFRFLYKTPFTYSLAKDGNRAMDGIDMRYRFATDTEFTDAEELIDGPCSMLEMLVALAVRCEEQIMSDPDYGDRTAQWFWRMLKGLGISHMYSDLFDKKKATEAVDRFLNREYEPDGTGSIFKIKNPPEDLRNVEIWVQLNWYLNTII